MHEKLLLLGIDEFTFTVILRDKIIINKWEDKAHSIIDEILRYTLLEKVLDGQLEEMSTGKPEGYLMAYNLGLKDYYLAIGYHPSHPAMGVCVRFSAKAWAIYQARYVELYGTQILLPELIKRLADNISEIVRLTRIDMTADYFNYGIDLNNLYTKLESDKIVAQNDDGRNAIKKLEFFGKDKHVETIYIGSKKEGSRGYLRVYDKRKEQIETNGFRKNEAMQCSEWIRFEAVYKGKYAHKISETFIQNQMDDVELTAYIAQIITQKYRFFDLQDHNYVYFSKDLISIAEESRQSRLRSESPRDNSLSQSIQHLIYSSGLYSTLYKIRCLYGEAAEMQFIDDLYLFYQKGEWLRPERKKELDLWLKKHEMLKKTTLHDNY